MNKLAEPENQQEEMGSVEDHKENHWHEKIIDNPKIGIQRKIHFVDPLSVQRHFRNCDATNVAVTLLDATLVVRTVVRHLAISVTINFTVSNLSSTNKF